MTSRGRVVEEAGVRSGTAGALGSTQPRLRNDDRPSPAPTPPATRSCGRWCAGESPPCEATGRVARLPRGWDRGCGVGHGTPGRAGRSAEQQTQGPPGDVRERGRGAGSHFEAEMCRVERDRGFNVIDDVADAHHLVRLGRRAVPTRRVVIRSGHAGDVGESREEQAMSGLPRSSARGRSTLVGKVVVMED